MPEPSAYQALKLGIMAVTGLSKDALHVYIGVILLLVTARLRGRLDYRALLPGLAFCLLGEALDLVQGHRQYGRWVWEDSVHDLVHTNLLPVVIVSYFYRRASRTRDESRSPGSA